MRVLILAAGEGTNAQALIDAVADGRLEATLVGLISHRPGAPALARAARDGLPTWTIPHPRAQRRAAEEALGDRILALQPDLVVLVGWMRILGPELLTRLPMPLLNLHPALPGAAPGPEAIARTWAQGVGGGVMVHRVTAALDAGPVILAEGVEHRPGEPLAAFTDRVRAVEHRLIVEAVGLGGASAVTLRRRGADPRAAALPRHGLAIEEVIVEDRLWSADAGLRELVLRARLDPLTEDLDPPRPAGPDWVAVELGLRPGVADPVAAALGEAAPLVGLPAPRAAAAGRRIWLRGPDAARLAPLLAPAVIERLAVDRPLRPAFLQAVAPPAPVVRLDRRALAAANRDRRLALDPAELAAITAHFDRLGRDPTDLELETLAQTWSEHCSHKSFHARITYDEGGPVQIIEGLLPTFFVAPTTALHRPFVRAAFADNAGIIAFDEDLDLAVKVETHNRPSALAPYAGAHTGVGGVIRDVLGVSAQPIAILDVLCFGLPDTDPATLPPGVIHPAEVAAGVIAGVEGYGNPMGIPTVAGAIVYDSGYTANPLVFAGCVGVLPRGAHRRAPRPGDHIVVVGGPTGRDGLGGATFSSAGLAVDAAQVSGSAVQLGDPIAQLLLSRLLLQARDEGLFTAITDCGAGGLSSAIGELAQGLGGEVDLDAVPVKYAGLCAWERWLSESQERMVLAVPPEAAARLQALAASQGVGMAVLGAFADHGQLRVRWQGELVGELDLAFLFGGRPRRELVARWRPPAVPPAPPEEGLVEGLLARMGSVQGQSRRSVVARFDQEVQGGTLTRPCGGPGMGPNDGAVLLPAGAEGPRALAIGLGLGWGDPDPRRMALAAVDEAVRNLVCLGGDPDQVSLLDNFCWGDPRDPERLGALVRAAMGCRDGALAYGAPFVSGKDSLNNERPDRQGQRRPIPDTLLITGLAPVPHLARRGQSALRAAGDLLFVVGPTRDDPAVPAGALARYREVHGAMRVGLVASAHDPAEGGLAVALAEMALGGDFGVEVELAAVAPTLRPDRRAFSADPGRIVLAIPPAAVGEFRRRCPAAIPIGAVCAAPTLSIDGAALSLADLREVWDPSAARGAAAG